MTCPKDRESHPADTDLVDAEDELPSEIKEVREVQQSNGGSISVLEAGIHVISRRQEQRAREQDRKGRRKMLISFVGAALVVAAALVSFGRFQGSTEQTLKTAAREASKTSKAVDDLANQLQRHDHILVKINTNLTNTEKAVQRLEKGVEKNRTATENIHSEVQGLRYEVRRQR